MLAPDPKGHVTADQTAATSTGSAVDPETPTASTSRDLNIYYGKFLAVADVDMDIQPRSVTALIGPSGCGKSTFLRSLNRMHEVIAGARVEGSVLAQRRRPLRARGRPGRACAARSAWCSSVPTRSRRCRSHENVLAGKRAQPEAARQADADDIVERSLRGANLWDEVKDRLDTPGGEPVGRPAAASLHRPGDRRRARGAADGRAVLGARPDLDAGDRAADARAQGDVHDRDRDPQHAAGRPRQRAHGVLQHRGHRQARPPGRDGRRPR